MRHRKPLFANLYVRVWSIAHPQWRLCKLPEEGNPGLWDAKEPKEGKHCGVWHPCPEPSHVGLDDGHLSVERLAYDDFAGKLAQ